MCRRWREAGESSKLWASASVHIHSRNILHVSHLMESGRLSRVMRVKVARLTGRVRRMIGQAVWQSAVWLQRVWAGRSEREDKVDPRTCLDFAVREFVLILEGLAVEDEADLIGGSGQPHPMISIADLLLLDSVDLT